MTAILEKLTLYWAYPFVRYALIVGVESADASHVGGYRVVYGKERLVFAALRTVVGGFRGTFVPAAFVIRGGVVVCLAVVGAIISGFTQPLREEDVCRSIV